MNNTKLKYAPETIKKHRRDWLKKLESGEVRQVRGQLCKTQHKTGEPLGYCCLGVASMMAKLETRHEPGNAGNKYRHGTLWFKSRHVPDSWASELLPRDAQDWLGVTTSNPAIMLPANHKYNSWGDPRGITLSELNDKGLSFKQIAALVREYGFSPDHDALQE